MCMVCIKRDNGKGKHYAQNGMAYTGKPFPHEYTNLFPMKEGQAVYWLRDTLTPKAPR